MSKIVKKKLKDRSAQWKDETKMSCIGIMMVLRKISYLSIAISMSLIFSYILTLFASGNSTWQLLKSNLPLEEKAALGLGLLAKTMENFSSWEGLILILLAILQGVSLALLIFVWKGRDRKASISGLEASGVGSALSFLAIGCPSCSISLLTPLLVTIAGTSALFLVNILGWFFAVAAILLLLHAIRRMGYSAFIILSARRKRNGEN